MRAAMVPPSFVKMPLSWDFSYCITFGRKIKEIFSADPDFFAKTFQPAQRKRPQGDQLGQGIHPKIPHRPQRRRKGAEEHHRAAGDAQQQVQPQLPCPAQQKQKDRAARRQAVQQVQRRREPGQPQPEGTQQIIQQSRRQAQ
nr:hypothetical protein [Dysosmobacter sp.]